MQNGNFLEKLHHPDYTVGHMKGSCYGNVLQRRRVEILDRRHNGVSEGQTGPLVGRLECFVPLISGSFPKGEQGPSQLARYHGRLPIESKGPV